MNKIAIVIIVVVAMIVYGIFAIDYIKQGPEQDSLLAEIEDVKHSIQELPEPSQDYIERMEAVSASLDAEYSAITGETNSSDVIENILSVAQDAGVKAIPLVTQPWVDQNVRGTIYRIFRVEVEAYGAYAQVSEFITTLENDNQSTLIVENLSVTIDIEDEEEEEGYTGGATPVIAKMILAVYNQPSTY